jgi:hypothetical protein
MVAPYKQFSTYDIYRRRQRQQAKMSLPIPAAQPDIANQIQVGEHQDFFDRNGATAFIAILLNKGYKVTRRRVVQRYQNGVPIFIHRVWRTE